MSNLLLVGIGGFFGAISRYGLGSWIQGSLNQPKFPWHTMAVNLVGCFAIGVLYALHFKHYGMAKPLQLLVFTGFLGGFTTFSTFGWETLVLLREGDPRAAMLYMLGSLILGVLAVWGAFALVSAFAKS